MDASDHQIISRKDAKALGLRHYFTGKKCKQGHIAPSYVSTARCIICNREITNSYRSRNPEKTKDIAAKSYQRNAEAHRARSRAWRANNKERHKEQVEKWREANPEAVRAMSRRKYSKHPEAYRLHTRIWREKNKDLVNEKARAFRENNRERLRARERELAKSPQRLLAARVKNANRAARKRAAEGSHEKSDILQLFDAQRGKCAYCRSKLIKYHVDHIRPLSRGGSNSRDNLQLCCPACNTKKRDIDPIQFAQGLGLLL